MIATLGEAHDLGWRVRVYCRFGKREALKSIQSCTAYVEIDLATLILTRGRNFPIARLDTRMKCPVCGSPSSNGRVRSARESRAVEAPAVTAGT